VIYQFAWSSLPMKIIHNTKILDCSRIFCFEWYENMQKNLEWRFKTISVNSENSKRLIGRGEIWIWKIMYLYAHNTSNETWQCSEKIMNNCQRWNEKVPWSGAWRGVWTTTDFS